MPNITTLKSVVNACNDSHSAGNSQLNPKDPRNLKIKKHGPDLTAEELSGTGELL